MVFILTGAGDPCRCLIRTEGRSVYLPLEGACSTHLDRIFS